ncbi:MAG TPA: metal-sulfur cluster assembly factor [Candidatus Limnocylindria bacterium]|nr:metal-sulfur cluster assembly factor [Candidatus Limnocylindria bacterium]
MRAIDPLDQRVWRALAQVEDPEMPINIVDLGLVYGVHVDSGRVRVDLTFTAMGCPATDLLVGDIRDRLAAEPGVLSVELNVVWNPPWTAARLSPAGRETLIAWGLAV